MVKHTLKISSNEFCETSKNTFSTEHPGTTTSVHCKIVFTVISKKKRDCELKINLTCLLGKKYILANQTKGCRVLGSQFPVCLKNFHISLKSAVKPYTPHKNEIFR